MSDAQTPTLMPAAFIGHGSPMNALEHNRYTEAWRAFGRQVPRPRAILVISAHWYINATAVTAMAQPRTIHDFYGFPDAAVRRAVPRARRSRTRRRDRRAGQADVGRPRRRQLGHRPRHLVGARARVPRRRRSRSCSCRSTPTSRSTTTSSSARGSRPLREPRRADRRQRQRRAQPRRDRLELGRRRVRLGRNASTSDAARPAHDGPAGHRCGYDEHRRLRRRRADARPLHPAALLRRPGRSARTAVPTCSSTATPTARCR